MSYVKTILYCVIKNRIVWHSTTFLFIADDIGTESIDVDESHLSALAIKDPIVQEVGPFNFEPVTVNKCISKLLRGRKATGYR